MEIALFSIPLIECILFIVFFIIIFYYTSQKKIAIKLDKPFTLVLFIFILPTIILSPFQLQDLALGNVPLTKLIARLLFYSVILILFKAWFRGFLQSAIELFKEPFLAFLILLEILSFIWSDSPGLTLRASLAGLAVAMLAAHVAKRYSWEEISYFVRWNLAITGVLSLLAVIFLPSTGRLELLYWRGVFVGSKALPIVMSLNILLWYWYIICRPKRPWMPLGITLLSVALLSMGRAISSVFILLALLCLLTALRLVKQYKFRQAPLIVLFFLIIGISGYLLITENASAIILASGRDTNLTGRAEIWPQVLRYVAQRPWIGYGYAGFWQFWKGPSNPAASIFLSGYVPGHAHNGFLEILLQLGIPGLLLYVSAWLRALTLALTHAMRAELNEASLPLIVLLFLAFTNFTETERLGLIGPNFYWFYFVLIHIRLNLESRRSLKNSETMQNMILNNRQTVL